MKISRESMIHNKSPEYRHALQELIKFELQALVERLSATGEEALVLTASCQEGTSMQFGSQKAESFLRKQVSLGQDFLTFCNDDTTQSSGDEMCNSGDEIEDADPKEDDEDATQKESSPPLQFSPNRSRERTSSKRISFSEEHPQDRYEDTHNSDLSASERNDSVSSVASFVDAEDNEKSNISALQCRVCCRHFRSYKTLKVHMRLHMAKSYKCAVCGKIFTLKKSYQRHIAGHKRQNKGKLFDCGICDKSFADLNAWKRHREIHLEVRNYSCNLCGKAFVEKYSLRVHQTSHFYPAAKNDKNIEPTSGFPCHICGKVSKTKTAIKKHVLMHSAKKYTCEFCNKRFSVKYSYVRHRRIHTGERPYKCGFCERSFSDSSAWAKHVRMHTGGKQYSCDLCSKSFYDKTLCKTHMKRHQAKSHSVLESQSSEKRNFDIVSSDIQTERKPENKPDENMEYSHRNSQSAIYREDLNLRLEVSDKESEDSRMLDSGFGTSLLSPREEIPQESQEKSPDKKFTSIIESIGLDEKFQTEFVERNMPSKPVESDNELISATFPDDSDLLEEETETENQPVRDLGPKYGLPSPQKKDPGSPIRTFGQPDQFKFEKKSNQRKSHVGKIIPDSPAKCKKCNKKFKQDSMLKQHLQFHCMMKLYKCRYCGKQLTTKQSLIRHERIHMGDRPYQCYICQKTFADNYGCIRHMNNMHFNKEAKGVSTRGSLKNSIPKDLIKSGFEEKQKPIINQTKSSPPIHFATYQQKTTCRDPYDGNVEVQSKQIAKETTSQPLGTSKPPNQQLELKSETELNSVQNQPTDQLITSEEKKHFFKCFRCPALFPSQQLCVEHIQQVCLKKKVEENSVHKSPSLPLTEKLSNIYQCMICLKMFSDKEYCSNHIANECERTKADTNSEVQSYCADQSILEESMLNSEHEGIETLPRLPFPEISSEPDFFSSDDHQDLLLSGNTLTGYVSSMVKFESAKNQSSCTQTKTSSGLHVANSGLTQSVNLMTPSNYVAQPGNMLTQPTYEMTSTAQNISVSQSALQHSQSNIIEPQFSVSQPAHISLSENSSSSSWPKQNTLLFIPFGQIPGQSSTAIRLPLTSSQQSPTNVSLSSLNQKPVVNIGTSRFVVTNHNINEVGNPTAGSSKSVSSTGKLGDSSALTSKTGKLKKTKGSECDISERTCSICAKVFTTKHIVKQHMLIHAERNFGCKYCMKKFHNKYGRDRHERIHTGETPFSCPNCKKSFGDNSTYRKHTWKCCSGGK